MLSTILFLVSIFVITFYVFFKFKVNKEFSFASTFPFESNKNQTCIKVSLLTTFIFGIVNSLFYVDTYFKTFKNSYVIMATFSAIIICGLFVCLNIINLVNLKLHFFAFSFFAALVTTQSVILGFHAINAYKIDGVNVGFFVIAILYFIKAVFELLLVSPLFKFSFLMNVNKKEGTLEKPSFIRLAFYEWLYLFFFIVNGLLLLITKMM